MRKMLFVLGVVACSREATKTVPVDASTPVASAVADAAPEASDDPQRHAVRETKAAPALSAALTAAKPLGLDTRTESSTLGAMTIAAWAATHLAWKDVVVSKDETSIPLAMKDINEARGKRLCRRGSVQLINAYGDPPEKIFAGYLAVDDGLMQFLAVKSTGEIVVGSQARICGAVVGLSAAPTKTGERNPTLAVVGIFDLPENK